MAKEKVVIEGSNGVSASQLQDFFRQMTEGNINGHQFQAFLEKRNPFEQLPFQFLTKCKTEVITVESLAAKLISFGVSANSESLIHLAKIISNAPKHPRRIEVGTAELLLVKIRVKDLGFIEPARYTQIFQKVIGQEFTYDNKKYIVDFCPIETASFLRLQYNDQPKRECLFIGSVVNPEKDHEIFSVSNHYGMELGFGIGQTDNNSLYPFTEVVFCLRKK